LRGKLKREREQRLEKREAERNKIIVEREIWTEKKEATAVIGDSDFQLGWRTSPLIAETIREGVQIKPSNSQRSPVTVLQELYSEPWSSDSKNWGLFIEEQEEEVFVDECAILTELPASRIPWLMLAEDRVVLMEILFLWSLCQVRSSNLISIGLLCLTLFFHCGEFEFSGKWQPSLDLDDFMHLLHGSDSFGVRMLLDQVLRDKACDFSGIRWRSTVKDKDRLYFVLNFDMYNVRTLDLGCSHAVICVILEFE
jgi:hypothetical protein